MPSRLFTRDRYSSSSSILLSVAVTTRIEKPASLLTNRSTVTVTLSQSIKAFPFYFCITLHHAASRYPDLCLSCWSQALFNSSSPNFLPLCTSFLLTTYHDSFTTFGHHADLLHSTPLALVCLGYPQTSCTFSGRSTSSCFFLLALSDPATRHSGIRIEFGRLQGLSQCQRLRCCWYDLTPNYGAVTLKLTSLRGWCD